MADWKRIYSPAFGLGMTYQEGFATLLAAIIGAGVFALPGFARQLGWYSIIFIFLALMFSLGLGYLILAFTPGSVEDEVERVWGKKVAYFFKLINISITLLALVAYVTGAQAHLDTNIIVLLFFMFIPLFLNLNFPQTFSFVLALFTMFFLMLISASNLNHITSFPVASMNWGYAGLLMGAAYFAFFGHTLIPRVRVMVKKVNKVWELLLITLSIAFVLYLVFTLTTLPLGVSDLATTMLETFHSGNLSTFVSLSAILIFYTSFILYGLHLQDLTGRSPLTSGLMVISVVIIYLLTQWMGMPFRVIIAAAGFCISAYAFVVALTALRVMRPKKTAKKALSWTLMVFALLPWLFFLIG